MKARVIAVAAASICLAGAGRADERPAYDPVIEQAAIAILQGKLPELRGGAPLEAASRRIVVPEQVTVRETRTVAVEAHADGEAKPRSKGSIVWF